MHDIEFWTDPFQAITIEEETLLLVMQRNISLKGGRKRKKKYIIEE